MTPEVPTILYIEDDEQSSQIIHFILIRIMHLPAPYLFRDSENLLGRIANLPRKPDVILTDLHITPHNGYDILHMVRSQADYQRIPVVALTASVMSDEVEKMRKAGFHSLISKPVRAHYLQTHLPEILQGKSVWVLK